MALKHIILYDRRRVRPQTIDAMYKAKSGALIDVERSELESFVALQCDIPDDQEEVVLIRKERKGKDHGKEKGRQEEAPQPARPGGDALQQDAEEPEQEQ